MTLDLVDLQEALFRLEADMSRVREDVARLRRFADTAAESDLLPSSDFDKLGIVLPHEIRVRRPDVVAGYVAAHPDVKDLVADMAAALVEELRSERSEIELALYQDPEIDDQQLTFYVRVSEYDDSFMERIDAVSERVESGRPPTLDWVLVTTDFRPMR
jgi:hypothetical protein